ncbi:MAG: CRTAC1 family protein, partial [bacterium]
MTLALATLGACGSGEPAAPEVPAGPACADPARGPEMGRFADATAKSGVDFVYTTTGFQGGGLAVVDLDGDGLPDIVAGRRGGGLALWKNLGELRFEERGGTGLDATWAATAISAIDLDNDGDRDLVIASAGVARVLANDGDLRFHEAARLDDAGTTEHVLPVDLDGDGLLDLYVGNYDRMSLDRTQNRLYMNRGGLVFGPGVAAGAGLTWTTTALDLDGDGDQDLYVANDTLRADFGLPPSNSGPAVSSPWPVDLVLRNDGAGPDGTPRFTDLAAEVGLASPRSSMGGLLGDFDDGGQLDLYVPDFGAKKLFLRDAAGGYVERAVAFGLTATARATAGCDPDATSEDCLVLSWSAALADFDLDGHDELIVVNGETSPSNPPPPVLVFTRGTGLPYREVAPEIACSDARGLVVTDLDGDGDADVVIAPRDGPLAIYENRGRPAAGTWLHVTLHGHASNRDGAGAIVTAHMASGRTQMRAVASGGVIHSAYPAEASFGLGDDAVTSVEVAWPSGLRSVVTAPP